MSASSHRLYHRLQLAAHHLRKTSDRAIGEVIALTTAQASVLSVLAREGRSTQRTIARELGLNDSAVTPMVARLVSMELVSRARDQIDARAWSLELSEKGKIVLKSTKSPFAAVNAVLDREFSEAEIRILTGYLNRMIDVLE